MKDILKKIFVGVGVWFASMILLALIGSFIWPVDSGKEMSPIYPLVILILPVLLAFRAAGVKIKRQTGNENKDSHLESIKTVELPKEPTIAQSKKSGEKNSKGKTYRVAGTSFRTGNIINLASVNTDYELTKKELIEDGMTDERIWKYEFHPSDVELVPEPDNPYDPNAIKVVVDGEHIGYIKSGSCAHLLNVIRENRILDISCRMGGGPYKYISEEYDEEKDKDVYTLERGETNLFAELTINEI